MSSYIDADEAEKLLRAGCAYAIWELPSIDIVFCKECKYEPICTHSVQHTTHEPTSVTIGYKTVEWCSYGERESE